MSHEPLVSDDPTSRPLDQSGPSECPLLEIALTSGSSAMDGLPQEGHGYPFAELHGSGIYFAHLEGETGL